MRKPQHKRRRSSIAPRVNLLPRARLAPSWARSRHERRPSTKLGPSTIAAKLRCEAEGVRTSTDPKERAMAERMEMLALVMDRLASGELTGEHLLDWRILPDEGWAEDDIEEDVAEFLTDQMFAVREAARPYLQAGLPPEALLAIVSQQAGTRVQLAEAEVLSQIVADLRKQDRTHLLDQVVAREPGKLRIIVSCLAYTTTVYALKIRPVAYA